MDIVKKNVFVLALGQAFFTSVTSVLALTAGLVGYQLIKFNVAYATIPVSAMVIGAALSAAPAAKLMIITGRKNGFLFGNLIGLLGALICISGIYFKFFWIFSFGVFLIGIFNGFAHQYRFAAADIAEQSFKAKAISFVLAGGIFAAYLGPEIASKTSEIFPDFMYLGSYIAVSIILLISIVTLLNINIDKKYLKKYVEEPRKLFEIIKQPLFILSVSSSTVGFSIMILIMTATPIAMIEHCNHTLNDAKFVVQWHVVAMFAPSFFTGSLINKFGYFKIIGTGIFFMLLAILFAILGNDVIHFWLSMFVLGLGWNFMFVGGSSLLTETYSPPETSKAQGFHDFIVFYSVAISSIGSGILLEFFGWKGIGIGSIPLVIFVIFILIFVISNRNKFILKA